MTQFNCITELTRYAVNYFNPYPGKPLQVQCHMTHEELSEQLFNWVIDSADDLQALQELHNLFCEEPGYGYTMVFTVVN